MTQIPEDGLSPPEFAEEPSSRADVGPHGSEEVAGSELGRRGFSEQERQLEERAVAGDLTAVAQLLQANRPWFYVVGSRMLGPEGYGLIDELIQDTFIRAARKVGELTLREGRASVAPWLGRIYRNLILDYLGSSAYLRTRSFADYGDSSVTMIDSTALSPEVEVANRMAVKRVLGEISACGDPLHREILTMRFRGEMTSDEIATTLNQKLSLVKGVIERFRRRMEKLQAAGVIDWP